LIGVTLYMASLGHDVPFGWWLVMGAMVIAILALRRALQWRYPYRKQKRLAERSNSSRSTFQLNGPQIVGRQLGGREDCSCWIAFLTGC